MGLINKLLASAQKTWSKIVLFVAERILAVLFHWNFSTNPAPASESKRCLKGQGCDLSKSSNERVAKTRSDLLPFEPVSEFTLKYFENYHHFTSFQRSCSFDLQDRSMDGIDESDEHRVGRTYGRGINLQEGAVSDRFLAVTKSRVIQRHGCLSHIGQNVHETAKLALVSAVISIQCF